jgi:uncharacterized membrane protein
MNKKDLAKCCYHSAIAIVVLVIFISLCQIIFRQGDYEETSYTLYVSGSLLFALLIVAIGGYYDGAAADEEQDRNHPFDDDEN